MSQPYCNILAPVSRTEFHADYREQIPLHIERSASDYFRELLSLEDIEALLSTGSQYFPDVQLVNSAVDIPVSDYTDSDRRIVTPGLWGHYRSGATIVISGAQRRFTRLADLCRTVSQEFCMRSQANAYLSPGSNQGFKPHYDTHDVFVLQVSGSKLFRFYHSDVALPFSEETFPADYVVKDTVQETILLTAGDTLYIPRGIVHDAVAQTEDPSLHITLGVFPLVVRDVLQEMVQAAAERNVELRRAIDLQSPVTDDTLQLIKQQLNSAVDQSLFEAARSRLFDEVAIAMTPSGHGQLTAVAEDARFAIESTAIISAERNDSLLKLRVAGQVLEFPEPFATAVQQLIDHETIAADELVGLNKDQRTALLDQLRNVNCIRVVLDS